MFFLLRSALCITAVVMALPDRAQPTGAVTARAAVTAVHDLCHADPQACLSFVREQLGTVWHQGASEGVAPAPSAIPLTLPKRLSVDTLAPADRRPAWNGPSTRRL